MITGDTARDADQQLGAGAGAPRADAGARPRTASAPPRRGVDYGPLTAWPAIDPVLLSGVWSKLIAHEARKLSAARSRAPRAW
jgi:hypothetical protein